VAGAVHAWLCGNSAMETRAWHVLAVRRQPVDYGARAPHAAYDHARHTVALHIGGEAHQGIPQRERSARGVDPAEPVHTAAKHNAPSPALWWFIRFAREVAVMPLSRSTRALVAIAAVSFPVIVVAYLVAPPDHWARALAYGAAAVLVVVGTLLLARFAHSLRVDRRYADLLENE